MFQNNERAAMLVFQTSPVGVKLFSLNAGCWRQESRVARRAEGDRSERRTRAVLFALILPQIKRSRVTGCEEYIIESPANHINMDFLFCGGEI